MMTLTDQPPRAPIARPVTVKVALTVNGAEVAFDVAPGRTGPAFFAMGVRKSGSSMFNQIMAFLAQRNGVPNVTLPDRFFRLGLRAQDWAGVDLSPLLHPGNLYSAFRVLPPNLAQTAAFRGGTKVFLFRDPRDALVSQYFSDAYSHPLPDAKGALGDGRAAFEAKRATALETPIDDFVLRGARSMLRTLTEYAPLLDDPACLCLRYEDFVFQKRRLVRKVLAHFGWHLSPGQIEMLMGLVDKLPDTEDKTRFLRKAVPGDHRVKLKPETIAELDKVLRPVLIRYDC